APLRRAKTTGIRLSLGEILLEHPRPVQVRLSSQPDRPITAGYQQVETASGLLCGLSELTLANGAVLRVQDEWSTSGRTIRCKRRVAVLAAADVGFATALCLRRGDREAGWPDVAPFAPGAVYGDAEPVPELAIGGAPQR